MQRWYVVQSKYGQEDVAAYNLVQQDFLPYIPRIIEKKMIRGTECEISKPLFPQYLFVRFDIEKDRWKSICSTKGVAQLVTANETHCTPLPMGFVEDLMEQGDRYGNTPPEEVETVINKFCNGDEIKVVGGSFQGLSGTYIGSSLKNIVILLDLLSSKVRVSLPSDQVELV